MTEVNEQDTTGEETEPLLGLDDFDPADEVQEEYVSLASVKGRVQAAREAAEQDTSHKFAVPFTNETIWVELAPVGQDEQDRILTRNQRQPARLRGLYSNADILLKATVGFHAVIDPATGRTAPVAPSENDWVSVARLAYPKIGTVTPRQAFLRLMNVQANPAPAGRLYREYEEWLQTQGEYLVEELEKGFAGTP